jgi:hypothetical protein
MPASSPLLSPCIVCGASTLLVCAVCLKPHFCSRPCAAKAWAGHRAACAEFSVLPALPDDAQAPVPPAAPLASTAPDAGAGGPEPSGTGFACAVCGKADAAVCARCRLVGYCGAAHQRKDWPAHKVVCRKGEFGVVPELTWDRRMLAEAAAAAPASRAATAALPPIAVWFPGRDGAPPTKIMRAWRKAADGGHAVAQAMVGFCHDIGAGVAQDFPLALAWYAKAAAQGCAAGQVNLAVCYSNGTGVAQNYVAAFELFAKAAAQGHGSAQYYVGAFYADGKGVAQNSTAAVEWYAKAAARGNARAQLSLGNLYAKGQGVAQDFNAAAAWFAKAAARGEADAPARRDDCLARAAAAASHASAARS